MFECARNAQMCRLSPDSQWAKPICAGSLNVPMAKLSLAVYVYVLTGYVLNAPAMF